MEAVLSDFRAWLLQLASQGGGQALLHANDRTEEPAVDLHTLVSQFTALRHEVNLQTKAVRAQQEQNAETLRLFGQALEELKGAQETQTAASSTASDEQLRPLLKTLVDLYDALVPGLRESRRVQEAILPLLDQLSPAPLPAFAPQFRLPAWTRWFGQQAQLEVALQEQAERWTAAVREDQQRHQDAVAQSVQQVRQLLASLVAGYTMSLQRIDRALQQHGLEPIPCLGKPFDPERMEVLEVVGASGRPDGEVVDEIRRGYLWRGRVFRYAQVRVAKSS